jgi:hypothetical protein
LKDTIDELERTPVFDYALLLQHSLDVPLSRGYILTTLGALSHIQSEIFLNFDHRRGNSQMRIRFNNFLRDEIRDTRGEH